MPKQSRKDPLKEFLKQSGARSAPGKFGVIYGPKQQKIGKYRNPARETRRGNFGVFGVQKQQTHRESSTVSFNKNAVASEKTLIDSKNAPGLRVAIITRGVQKTQK